jgi:hypothetical protein
MAENIIRNTLLFKMRVSIMGASSSWFDRLTSVGGASVKSISAFGWLVETSLLAQYAEKGHPFFQHQEMKVLLNGWFMTKEGLNPRLRVLQVELLSQGQPAPLDKDSGCYMYVPAIGSYKAVDAILVRVRKREEGGRHVELLGEQITLR